MMRESGSPCAGFPQVVDRNLQASRYRGLRRLRCRYLIGLFRVESDKGCGLCKPRFAINSLDTAVFNTRSDLRSLYPIDLDRVKRSRRTRRRLLRCDDSRNAAAVLMITTIATSETEGGSVNVPKAGDEKYRGVQKVWMNGSSPVLTLVRPVMFGMQILPGEFIEVWVDKDGVGHFRPWSIENAQKGRGPGQIFEKPAELVP